VYQLFANEMRIAYWKVSVGYGVLQAVVAIGAKYQKSDVRCQMSERAEGTDRETVRMALGEENIEARPVWKPMHLQPVFNPQITQNTQMNGRKKAQGTQTRRTTYQKADVGPRTSDLGPPTSCRVVGGEVAEDLFNRGLCLPSGTGMTNGDLDRVIETILKTQKK